ncbi:hypothetical protein L226DRAFT_576862 [Lentinus tigrinus ALCF2SS1-7]|uniref:uncharacterized protein n=1 Tax=Lentinus tigrinus ALCF2SS1-7 TaxID=1328758 RepID=UPI00116608EE|nr:hypothetical protein L226DRAFT_576862 [Lentinus tigrinus ALCF2SS1-7]
MSTAFTFLSRGNSIFATPGHHVTAEDVKSFAQSVFGVGNVAVLGTGIEVGPLKELLQTSLGMFSSSAAPSSTPSSDLCQETFAPARELAVLASHLDPTPSVKWSQGTSPIAASVHAGTSVQPVLLPYSDASLFGLLVQGQTTTDVKTAAKAAVDALKTAGSPKGEELQKAVAKAKFSAASAFDVRDGLVSTVGSPKILYGSPTSINDAVSALEKVDASARSKAASSSRASRPSVAVGDLISLPHADELCISAINGKKS